MKRKEIYVLYEKEPEQKYCAIGFFSKKPKKKILVKALKYYYPSVSPKLHPYKSLAKEIINTGEAYIGDTCFYLDDEIPWN